MGLQACIDHARKFVIPSRARVAASVASGEVSAQSRDLAFVFPTTDRGLLTTDHFFSASQLARIPCPPNATKNVGSQKSQPIPLIRPADSSPKKPPPAPARSLPKESRPNAPAPAFAC